MKKTKTKRSYKYRAVIKKKSLYFYNCEGCGKKRSSRIYERALKKICQVCLKGVVPDNQPSLFNSPQEFGDAFNALAHHEHIGVDMAEGEDETRYRLTDKGRATLKEAREKGVDVSELI